MIDTEAAGGLLTLRSGTAASGVATSAAAGNIVTTAAQGNITTTAHSGAITQSAVSALSASVGNEKLVLNPAGAQLGDPNDLLAIEPGFAALNAPLVKLGAASGCAPVARQGDPVVGSEMVAGAADLFGC